MSRKGNCLDNACAECFFGTLKSESFYTSKFKDIDELKIAIEDYIRYSTIPDELALNLTDSAQLNSA
ncbi:IS3 family transposase [Salmonella enterica]|nr:IS3 family transposase [Salmonella enterica]EJV5377850.1 IS3 family transposase [Salmonella enterica]ELL3666706.1 IS3 family transposase [Salmonella enterica]